MNKPKVYITSPVPNEIKEYISEYCDVEMWESEDKLPKEELFHKVADKDGLLVKGGIIDKELLDHAPKLKAVSTVSVGYNNFDLDAMKSRGVIGTNTPYVLDDTVADLIFSLILSSARRIAELDSIVKSGGWKPGNDKSFFGVDVHHRTLGIIGMGRIGEAVAKRARFGFDMDVLYYNRNRKADAEGKLGVKYCDMQELIRKSDFILLMTALTNDTYHLIDYKEFDMMKNSAIFINASRGQTVNEEALIDALQSKKILGAGLDVFEKEPVNADNPLLKLSNVVTVPHIGSATVKTRFDMAMVAAENLVAALTGGTPAYIVPELKN
jgi:gluconate 2-dehydrogenase